MKVAVLSVGESEEAAFECHVIQAWCGVAENLADTIILLDAAAGGAIPLLAARFQRHRFQRHNQQRQAHGELGKQIMKSDGKGKV